MNETGPAAALPLAERAFDMGDQHRFAEVSGDRNPIHVDPVAARRTMAGGPVVHGVHLLLWVLDVLATGRRTSAPLAMPVRLRVSFTRFLPVDEVAAVCLARRTPERIDVQVVACGIVRCTIVLDFGNADPFPQSVAVDVPPTADPLIDAELPADPPAEALTGMVGRVSAMAPAALAGMFPAATAWIGVGRLAALGACTRLVGMTCPGLRSLFTGIAVGFGDPVEDGTVGFRVGALRHGLVTIEVAGGGLAGRLTAAVRAAPSRQPGTAELRERVPVGIFADQRVLVAGGSRGLGELAAKLLAAGGADVAITWSTGEADAAAVAGDIRAAGGRCDTLRYRVGEAPDLAALAGEAPTHSYFFAAPAIARPSSQFFDAGRLAELHRFFVDGFWQFALALRERRAAVRLFYPSTTYVVHWPRGLAEYAMAKAAGEILCAEMNARLAPLTVVSARLPRLPTDQTAGIVETEVADPVDALLPLIRAVQNR